MKVKTTVKTIGITLAVIGCLYTYALLRIFSLISYGGGPAYTGQLHFFTTYDVTATFNKDLAEDNIGGQNQTEIREFVSSEISKLIHEKFGDQVSRIREPANKLFSKNPLNLSLNFHFYPDKKSPEYIYVQTIITRTYFTKDYYDFYLYNKSYCDPIVFFFFPDILEKFGTSYGSLACTKYRKKTSYEPRNDTEQKHLSVTWTDGRWVRLSRPILKNSPAAKDAIRAYLAEIVSRMKPEVSEAIKAETYFLEKIDK